jgi:hypothetical protein
MAKKSRTATARSFCDILLLKITKAVSEPAKFHTMMTILFLYITWLHHYQGKLVRQRMNDQGQRCGSVMTPTAVAKYLMGVTAMPDTITLNLLR